MILFCFLKEQFVTCCDSYLKKPTHVQAHFILLVPHKIKRAFSFSSLQKK